MAGQTTVLQRRKRCDHGLSITTNGGLLECLRCLVCFLVMALELAHIGADKTQDAHFFYQGRLWVIRNGASLPTISQSSREMPSVMPCMFLPRSCMILRSANGLAFSTSSAHICEQTLARSAPMTAAVKMI